MISSFRVDKNVDMLMRDGAVLRGDVWRPDDDQPHPVLLQRTPYRKEMAGDAAWFDKAVCAGYAVVVQDTRGRFASDGVWGGFTPEMWNSEARDTYDTVEWIASQSWCNGGVGMFGQSYVGAVALLGAELQPPHLKAIAPAKIGAQDMAYLDTGGAFWLRVWLTLPLAMLADDLPKRVERRELSDEEAADVKAAVQALDALAEFLPLQEWPHFDVPGMPTPFKQVLSGEAFGLPTRFESARITVPTLIIGGWFDFYAARAVEQFRRLRLLSGGGPTVRQAHQLLIGPWQHGPETPTQGDLDFGPDAADASLHSAQLAFFNRHLKGIDSSLPPVRYFVMGADEWRDADEWPPRDVRTHTWYLHSTGDADLAGGTLSNAAPATTEPPDMYCYDPADPTPSLGGRTSPLGGPRDISRLTARDDVLVYRSDPLAEPVELIGQVSVRLHAASTAVDTDFVAKLVDIHPDGRAIVVASGLSRARYRYGVQREVPLDPGAVEEYQIGLGPTALRVGRGHRIAVFICSSDFPWFDRNMNTGNALGYDAKAVVANQTIYHDLARPSRLEAQVRRPRQQP